MLDSPTAIVTAIIAVLGLLLGGANYLHQNRTVNRQEGQAQAIADRQHEQLTSMAYRVELQDEVNERREQLKEMREQLVVVRTDLSACRALCDACEVRAAQAQDRHEQVVHQLRSQIDVLHGRLEERGGGQG